jgi:hypothetical protein
MEFPQNLRGTKAATAVSEFWGANSLADDPCQTLNAATRDNNNNNSTRICQRTNKRCAAAGV